MVTLVPCRCCWDALMVHKHNRGNLAKPLRCRSWSIWTISLCPAMATNTQVPRIGGTGFWSRRPTRGTARAWPGRRGRCRQSSFIIPNMVTIIGLTMFKSSPVTCGCGNTDLNFSAFHHIISLTILLQRTLLHYSLYLSFKYLQITYICKIHILG